MPVIDPLKHYRCVEGRLAELKPILGGLVADGINLLLDLQTVENADD